MKFRRYDGFVGSGPQKKMDKGLPKCPFCGEYPHWLLEIQSGFVAKLTCMCEKCGGKLYSENSGFDFDDNMLIVDVGNKNLNNLSLNTVYHIKTLNTIAQNTFFTGQQFHACDDKFKTSPPATHTGSYTVQKNKKTHRIIFIISIIITFTLGITLLIDGLVDLFVPTSNDSNNYEISNNSSNNNSNVTMGERMALESAKNYLKTMGFSKKRLIEQLEYEGYSNTEATYAVNNCGANWNEQAVRVAKNYLNTMSFSKQGLKDQLIYEGFTNSEATYGVNEVYK